MASPPAKRQRRSTTLLSEDDDLQAPPSLRTSLKSSTRPSLSRNGASAQDSTKPQPKPTKRRAMVETLPKSSPEKSRKSPRNKKEPERIKSLHTFFDKASEAQRWRKKSTTPDETVKDEDYGDAIVDDDDFLDEELLGRVDGKTTVSAASGQDTQQLPFSASSLVLSQRQPFASSQRFVKPALPTKHVAIPAQTRPSSPQEHGHWPWSERYAPVDLEDLAVNRRKVAEVQNWLSAVMSGRNRSRLLVLKGAAGSGKSTTLALLAKCLGLRLVAWSNPTTSEVGANSIAQQFDDFLNRSGRFGSLLFEPSESMPRRGRLENSQRLLVVEEFPTTMTRSSVALAGFRSVLLQHLASSGSPYQTALGGRQASEEGLAPLVMIISETLLTSSTAVTDSFTAHRLLGPEVSNHPLTTVVEFNPVAPTFISKALDIVIRKEARDSRRRRMPGPGVIQRLSEVGDIRSAVNSLEFLCVRDDTGSWSGTVAAKGKRSKTDTVSLTAMEKSSLELVSQRESTLDMFHATGKIVYNKREDPRMSDTRAEPPPKPPDHLSHLEKPKLSQVDTQVLLGETGTDIQTFLSTLHENYVLSCNGDYFVDAFEGCSTYLSDSDVLDPDGRRPRRWSSSLSGQTYKYGGTDVLRQDEISFQVATLGLLFALPFPVNRAAHPGGRKGDSFKMFYPASLRLWKPIEETESLIAHFAIPNQTNPKGQATTEGVAGWNARSNGTDFGIADGEGDGDRATPRTYISRDELTLEILPYLAQMKGIGKENACTLSKITQFRGLRMTDSAEEPIDEESSEGLGHQNKQQAPTAEALGLQIDSNKVATAISKYARGQGQAQSLSLNADETAPQEVAIEKLYISDDDIQDD